MTQAEEIAALKVEVKNLKHDVSEMNRKLDDLLALRYKGIGAFWLASSLVGSGIIGFLYYLFGGK